jgi:hypothetical protein
MLVLYCRNVFTINGLLIMRTSRPSPHLPFETYHYRPRDRPVHCLAVALVGPHVAHHKDDRCPFSNLVGVWYHWRRSYLDLQVVHDRAHLAFSELH